MFREIDQTLDEHFKIHPKTESVLLLLDDETYNQFGNRKLNFFTTTMFPSSIMEGKIEKRRTIGTFFFSVKQCNHTRQSNKYRTERWESSSSNMMRKVKNIIRGLLI
jgi:hypothetical protein